MAGKRILRRHRVLLMCRANKVTTKMVAEAIEGELDEYIPVAIVPYREFRVLVGRGKTARRYRYMTEVIFFYHQVTSRDRARITNRFLQVLETPECEYLPDRDDALIARHFFGE